MYLSFILEGLTTNYSYFLYCFSFFPILLLNALKSKLITWISNLRNDNTLVKEIWPSILHVLENLPTCICPKWNRNIMLNWHETEEQILLQKL